MEIVGGCSSLVGGATADIDAFPPGTAQTARLRPDSASRRSTPGPRALHYSHPSHAKTFFKLVFLTDDSAIPLSIHNRTTRYSIGSALVQSGLTEAEGALHVLSNPIDAVLKEDRAAVACGHALHLRVAVAKVLAWNSNLHDVPALQGAKKVFSFVKVIDLLPVPEAYSGAQQLGRAHLPLPAGGGCSNSASQAEHERPQSVQPVLPAEAQVQAGPTGRADAPLRSTRSSTSAWWGRVTDQLTAEAAPPSQSVSGASLLNSVQATNVLLRDVSRMEERLKHMRGI